MTLKIKEVLIVSDLDGTLIGENFVIPQRNIDAIHRFQQKGGNFAIATGRSITSGGRYYHLVSPNAPSVLLNGALIYDFSRQEILKQFPLCEQAKEYVNLFHKQFPEAGIEVFTKDKVYLLNLDSYIQAHVQHEKMENDCFLTDKITDPWCKVLFAAQKSIKDSMESFSKTFDHQGVRFVSSSENYLEMLPAGIEKGTGILEISRLTGITPEKIYAIGDYYNDVEMLRVAGTAVVPENAPEDIKQMANLVVGHCYQGAVADLVEYIESKTE